MILDRLGHDEAERRSDFGGRREVKPAMPGLAPSADRFGVDAIVLAAGYVARTSATNRLTSPLRTPAWLARSFAALRT